MNCGNDSVSSEVANAEVSNQKTVITAKAIENFSYKDYVLSPDGEKAVEKWEKYQELGIQINYLRKADLSFFNGDKALLKKFIAEFIADLPPDFDTKPIVSRTIVIKTTLLKLNENLTLDNIDGALKLESVKEVMIAFSNLNYQINKKIIGDKYEQIKSDF
ncbi:hypothetical protein [Winogradskyella sp. PE311]|uniref:hypothetical protein n=1 Tax=Winogradskyella sp. PE311 TaxID=3366943 RepID=UPI00397F3600